MASRKKTKSPKKRQSIVSKSSSFWKNKTLVLPILGILALTFGIFSPTLNYDFVNWDDPLNILENPNLQTFDWASIKGIFSSTVIGNYNPLTILTFAVEKAFFGLNPTVFHFNNLLLHLVCIFLVYRIALSLKLNTAAAILVALLFAIHPMRVESVTWITERKDVLFGAFYLGAIFQYIRYCNSKQKQPKIYWSIIILFILSLLSKIQAVSLPLSFLAIDYWFKRPLKWNLVIEKIPYFALSMLIGVIGVILLKQEGSLEDEAAFSFIDRLFIGGYSYFIYLVKFIFPYEMSPLYSYPASIGTSFYTGTAISLLLVGGVFYAFKKDHRVVVFSFAFFTFNIFFVLQILGAGQGFLADRFTYIPYLGLFIGVGYAFQKLTSKNQSLAKLLPFGIGTYLLLFAYMTWQQNKVWENGETLWTKAIQDNESAVMAWSNRADFYQDNKQYNKAIRDYEQAIVLAPDKNTLYGSMGKTYFDMGQVQKAIEKYNIGINLPEPYSEILINRGVAYGAQKKFDLALIDINKGLSLDKDNANGLLSRGLIYYSQKQLSKAIPDLEKYLSNNQSTAENWFILGLSYRNTGDTKSAIPAYTQAIQINPSDKRYYNSRANAYQALGMNAEANRDLEMVKRL